jgi:hypothetical protein
MLKLKSKRSAVHAAIAVAQVAGIRVSIKALNDEDLLDLADIFAGKSSTIITDIASAEMKRRNLNLESHSTD